MSRIGELLAAHRQRGCEGKGRRKGGGAAYEEKEQRGLNVHLDTRFSFGDRCQSRRCRQQVPHACFRLRPGAMVSRMDPSGLGARWSLETARGGG